MIITSPSFSSGENIPSKFTCEGDPPTGGVNPEFEIHFVPEGTKSLALVMDDPDAPGNTFTHWLIWNIDPETERIKQASKPAGSKEGMNDARKVGYLGPCPPPGKVHHYHIRLFALDVPLDLEEGAEKDKVLVEIKKHTLEKTELVGVYERPIK